MPTQRRLGKGLGALLGESAVETARATEEGGQPSELAVDRIEPNRYQPRQRFEPDSIAELAASIGEIGILQPLIVTPRDGGYMLVSGERRLRAARQAGLATVPVRVLELDDRELLQVALVENLQREDLDPIEEATGYRRLADEFDLTQAEIAERVGRSRPAIANALRLLELPELVQGFLREGRLTAGHARALLGLADRSGLERLARRIVKGGQSVRQVERIVRRANGGPPEAAPKAAPRGSDELERRRLEGELREALGTKVALRLEAGGRGRIEIAFYSSADLERLVERLGVPAR